ncbi:MAG: adenosylmethionine--8-amino-7-oxononanoate transaminase [Deltaproteobacteria bacterium]|nr:adenosylmethionine--8-amino-7-oxononanoate transaminase [Deltaproteobacteria bacterium]
MREWVESDPVIIERGEGCHLIDTEGRRYLDGASSLWVIVHGHRKKTIDEAIKKQLDKIAHSTLLGLSNVPSIELAEKLVTLAPKGLTRVFYSDDGSTAVESALKMAFHYSKARDKNTRKEKFLAFTGAYHGDTLGGMSVGEIDVFVERYRPLLFKALRAPYPYCYRCPVKKKYPDCKIACLDKLKDILERRGPEIAACIIEPLMEGAAGMISAPPGFLKGVRRLTEKYGVLLIADCVATGFGRTGAMFACEHEGVSPDLMCLAKGMTGGYLPLAATLSTERIYRAFLGTVKDPDAFYHGHTYTGNPLGCAAALANIRIFEKERVLEKMHPKVRLLERLLNEFRSLGHVGDVRQRGLMAGVELVKDKKMKEPYPFQLRIGHRVCLSARDKGVIVRPLGDTIVIMPPLSITAGELKMLAGVIRDSIEEVTGQEVCEE